MCPSAASCWIHAPTSVPVQLNQHRFNTETHLLVVQQGVNRRRNLVLQLHWQQHVKVNTCDLARAGATRPAWAEKTRCAQEAEHRGAMTSVVHMSTTHWNLALSTPGCTCASLTTKALTRRQPPLSNPSFAAANSLYGVCDSDGLQGLQQLANLLRQCCCKQLLGAKNCCQLLVQLQLRQVRLHAAQTVVVVFVV